MGKQTRGKPLGRKQIGFRLGGSAPVYDTLAGVSELTRTCVFADKGLFTKMVPFGCFEAAAYLQQHGGRGVTAAVELNFIRAGSLL